MKKTILITGATKNTGLAIARRFAADGWNVVITSRDAAAAEAAAKSLFTNLHCHNCSQIASANGERGTGNGERGGPGFVPAALGLGMDPAKVEDIRAAFAAVKERFGRLDAFVNNAAHLGVGLSILNSTESDWNDVMNVNARAAFFGAQEAVKLMERGGSIVFISSCHAAKSVPGRILYTTSKAALGGIVRSLAVELGPLGIRANAILAGAVRTDRWDGLTDEEVAARRARWPAGKESSPDEIAAAVAFLCSDSAMTITGAEIPVDSGIGVCLLQYNKDWMQNDAYNVKYWEATKDTKK